MTMPAATRSFLRPLALALAALGACAAGATPYSIDPSGTIVTDQATALQWARCTFGQAWDGSGCTGKTAAPNWYNALQAAQTANAAHYLGYSDWRLPNVSEMESLMEMDSANPNIDLTAFPGTEGALYWTSTTDEYSFSFAWYASFHDGHVLRTDKTGLGYVRLVRGGQPMAAFDALAAPGPGPGPVRPAAPTAVPALGYAGWLLLSALVAGGGALRRRLLRPDPRTCRARSR
ncbi:DUF1566 domain-containing protein [Ottowia sp. VDI28]|uniref:Lcl C-terminal domain-containing protein n=1 Tax=Ottowia sp. VDI28 TaxID=3133968 RepID=UPI003C2AFE61